MALEKEKYVSVGLNLFILAYGKLAKYCGYKMRVSVYRVIEHSNYP